MIWCRWRAIAYPPKPRVTATNPHRTALDRTIFFIVPARMLAFAMLSVAAHVSARERTTRSPSSASDPMMSPVITISTVSLAMCTGWTITS